MEEKNIITYGVIFVVVIIVIVSIVKIYFHPSTSQPNSVLTNQTTSISSISTQHEFSNNTFNLTKSYNKILFGNTTYGDLFNQTYCFNHMIAINSYISSLPLIYVNSSIFLLTPAKIYLNGTSKYIIINLEGKFAYIEGGANPNATTIIMNGEYTSFNIKHIINNNAYNVNIP